MVKVIVGVVFAYFLGSVPTAYLFGRILKGVDIRQHGSGNVGATNAFRVLGKGPGILVLLIDVLKGVLAVSFLGKVLGVTSMTPQVIFGVAAVCGHNWTIFLDFKGGKGIATSLGVLIGLTISAASLRPVLLVCLLFWSGVFLASGYVSLSSMLAASLLPVLMLATGQETILTVLGMIFCVFVLLRHRPNIQRLLKGKESRVKMPYHKK